MNVTHEPLYYSVADACRVTSIGKTRLYELLSGGHIDSRKVGKRRLIVAASLRTLVEGAA